MSKFIGAVLGYVIIGAIVAAIGLACRWTEATCSGMGMGAVATTVLSAAAAASVVLTAIGVTAAMATREER